MLRFNLLLLCFLAGISLLGSQDFPPQTTVCQQGSFILENPLTDPSGLVFQWERSFDGGTSWSNALDGTSVDLTLPNPTTGISYRFRYAADIACLNDPNCASWSSATRIQVNIPEFFQSLTICEGESVSVGEDTYNSQGNFQTVIDAGDCDSIVNTFVYVYPAYDQLVFASLCPDEAYMGISYQRDTIFSQTYQSVRGCDSTITYEIDVSFPENIRIEGSNEVCQGETTVLSVNGFFSDYQWSTGSSDGTIAVGAGDYQLTISNSQGCDLELNHAVQEIDLQATVIPQAPSCPGTATGTLELIATGDDFLLYSFDNGNSFSDSPLAGNLPAGDYQLVVESPGGCQWREETTLVDAPGLELNTDLPAELIIERGDSIYLNVEADAQIDSWNWSPQIGLSCTDCPNPMARPLLNVTYELSAVAPGGCTESLAFSFEVRDNRRFYAPTAFSPNGDGQNETWAILPGPRTESVSDLTIFDRWGGTLLRREGSLSPRDPGLSWDGTSNGQTLEVGTYAYAAVLHFNDGTSLPVSGTINLIR
ncbi:MAG: T9SS type B sorting domain-containing protein [Bacteroidota bacterium]